MLWQIKLQDKKTHKVDTCFLKQFDSDDYTLDEIQGKVSEMVAEVVDLLPEDVIEDKTLYFCNEDDKHFTHVKVVQ